ncbi:MAG: sigma-70 family RNA polymerase sigma factor [Planctomycetota bacterium]
MPENRRSSPEREGELIRRCLAGDTASFGEIVESYEKRIFATIYRILGHSEDARDLAEEVFLRAWSKLDTFREGARFSTWLYTIALNLTRSELRKRKTRRKVKPVSLDALGGREDGPPPLPPDPAESPGEILGRRELHELALEQIAALEPDAREVVVLRDMQDLAYDEIAGITGVPIGTVRSRLFRARGTLRTALLPLLSARRKGGAA